MITKKIKITEEMTIGEIVQKYPKSTFVFLDFGLHCVGCQAASGETIAQACKSHRINLEDFLTALNQSIE